MAFDQNFKPDLLGTDLVTFNVYERPLFSLIYTMSMYLSLGYSFDEVVALCTQAPAKVMRMEGRLDTLEAGTVADICIMKLSEKKLEFVDKYNGAITGDTLIIPQMTIKAGKIVYRNIEF